MMVVPEPGRRCKVEIVPIGGGGKPYLTERFANEEDAMASGAKLASFSRKRMLEEETQHFSRCIRSVRIGVGTRRAASGPCVSGSVDFPMLKDSASGGVGMDRAGVRMPSGYLPAMHVHLRARPADGLPDNVSAVFRMYRDVAIAVEDNRRNGRAVA